METEQNFKKLYKIAGICAFLVVLIIPVQITIFVLFPPPTSALGFIELFNKNSLVGLLSLDFLYYINNALLAVFYLGLFVAMKNIDYTNMLIALILGIIGIAAYYASAVGFEMMSFSKQFYLTDSPESKQQILTLASGLITKYKGTAFDIYYVFNAISLLLMSKTMFKSEYFNKTDSVFGLIAGILMLVPSTAGTIGLIFSLVSLIPWIVFSVLVGKKLLKMA